MKMAIALNPSNFTAKQIEAAEPLIRAIEKYDRQIAAVKICDNVINEPFEKAKLRRDRIANIETKRADVVKQLEKILNARNEYRQKFQETEGMIDDLQRIKDTWGF